MPAITFYRQARRDGGIHTGIEIDGDTVVSRLDGGEDESDPTLDWYIDVRCRGEHLPRKGESARVWLVRNEVSIQRILRRIAGEIPAGIDPGDRPLQRATRIGNGATITVVCLAVRRVPAQQLAALLTDVADHWRQRIEELYTTATATV